MLYPKLRVVITDVTILKRSFFEVSMRIIKFLNCHFCLKFESSVKAVKPQLIFAFFKFYMVGWVFGTAFFNRKFSNRLEKPFLRRNFFYLHSNSFATFSRMNIFSAVILIVGVNGMCDGKRGLTVIFIKQCWGWWRKIEMR